MKYDNLYVVRVDRERRAQTCGYWYLVTSNSTSHTAHRTRKGLDLWLRERGLSLAGPLDKPYDQCRIVGSYSRVYESPETIQLLNGTPIKSLNNGDYGPGVVTVDADGHHTEHIEHGHGRTIFDYRQTQRELHENYEENEELATAV